MWANGNLPRDKRPRLMLPFRSTWIWCNVAADGLVVDIPVVPSMIEPRAADGSDGKSTPRSR
eukprot:4836469-Karenia_brevis.AAC.1